MFTRRASIWSRLLTTATAAFLAAALGCTGAATIFHYDPPCESNEVLYESRPCGPAPDGGVECGPTYGDSKCYQRCQSSSDCGDSARPYCGTIGLFVGDYACQRVEHVCRPAGTDDCPGK